MSMRYQLLLAFVAIIAIVLGTSWVMALRTTDTQFAILIGDANQRQARLMAPALLEEYTANGGDWAAVQTNLVEQVREQDSLAQAITLEIAPLDEGVLGFTFDRDRVPFLPPEDGISLYMSMGNGIQVPEWLVDRAANVPNTDRLFVIQRNDQHHRSSAILIPPPSISWAASNILLTSQRAIVIDATNTVVVDTAETLLGKRISEDFSSKGVTLYTSDGAVGALFMTAQQGSYSVEQNLFLQAVRRGFLMSALISGGIALLLASAIAYRVTRPIRSLTTAAARLQAGEWGYQVDFKRGNELGQLAQAFNQLSRHLAEQHSLRRRLVDDLAHELNTPLSLMRLEVQGMADGLQSPAEAAAHLNHELEEVTDLVTDLVFLANRDSIPAAEMDALDVNEVVRACVQRFEVSLKNGQRMVTQTHALPALHGDAYLIGRAVGNLLSNAIRHSPTDGAIQITTRYSNDQIEISVQDWGAGIDPQHMPHIFERFYRADSSRSRGSGGRGLGLAIVRQIMEQHGGAVWVESTPGKGSTFTLGFPVLPRASAH